ncbi:exosortase F system-associated protein [Flavobacterium sp. ANB]|uniref:exosortase F system-associated membrane protein n=1 Tax=unclassified Flavobacterium TaxID=196869 RepID=UPI0012B84ED2|nr:MULTISPECIES: exosortase F system-associated protein [unclassified Flavobacterium]MBF4514903.1 exosortase F system-associated protein [Flavobacterium sp. ANB]MTD68229.1 exosortase F system-associated protein [Flavobacterium sp. LC2016-13]
MLNKILEHKLKIIIAIIVVLCFAIIRAFERELFYDPFLPYFSGEIKDMAFPQVDALKLFEGLLFRYFLNTILSVLLIYSLFQDIDIVKFSIFLYVFFLIFLLGMFLAILNYYPDGSWLLFYVRRFIIQPIFVLLFIPAFYYQQQNLKK